ncbi:MAG: argininosuccinate lyase [Eubacteriales bacterium]|nr:argininosuccinate lyase [Eubacteriales bacterium]
MKLWDGRFEKENDAAMDEFDSSLSFDRRLYRYDIRGSIAHARMLGKCGIIPQADSDAVIEGLSSILADLDSGKLTFDGGGEDIHMFIESELTARIGEAGKRLHTARSRNDQVALDTRLYARDAVDALSADALPALIRLLCQTAEEHKATVTSGYTHLQKAQPITLGHHILSYAYMFMRDIERLKDARKRINILPLGSCALAGTTYPIDRSAVAEELGFDGVSLNSIDAVSDRDFVIETVGCCSLIMMHLSRFCEELALWSSNEFGLVTIDDAYATGSSIMPQKKNPDAAELIRGKTGRVYGDLTTLFTIMKGLPLAYNKDMQEDKPALFDALDTVSACLNIFTKMFATLNFHTDRMEAGAQKGFTNATDAADYLVRKGLPFREAHAVIGQMVLNCLKTDRAIGDLSLAELKAFCPLIEEDFYAAVDVTACVEARATIGGPAPAAVQASVDALRKRLLELTKE